MFISVNLCILHEHSIALPPLRANWHRRARTESTHANAAPDTGTTLHDNFAHGTAGSIFRSINCPGERGSIDSVTVSSCHNDFWAYPGVN
jgi:hypothetical protein